MSFRGISTIRLHATDHSVAVAWYTKAFGTEPYFERPGYTEFRIGDYETEVGVMDSAFLSTLGTLNAPTPASGTVIYWAVDDLAAEVSRLQELGATIAEEAREFGPGFVAAAMTDPFGNVLGVMENRHYHDVLRHREET